jgi:hypothetical protein
MYTQCKHSEQVAFDILKRELPGKSIRVATWLEDLAGTDIVLEEMRIQVKEQKAALRTGRFSFELAVLDKVEGWTLGNHFSSFTHYMLTAGCKTFYFVNVLLSENIINATLGVEWNMQNAAKYVGDYPGGIVVRTLSNTVKTQQVLSGHRHLDSLSFCVPISTIAEISQIYFANEEINRP